MSVFVFANNATTLIASGINTTDTTVVCAAGEGALFPTIFGLGTGGLRITFADVETV